MSSPTKPCRPAPLALALLLGCGGRPVVVIVGGGPAGLAAAVELEGAAEVSVYERADWLGGAAVYADAITALPDQAALARWDAAAGGPHPARARYAEKVQPDVVDWLGAMGTEWEPAWNPLDDGLALRRPRGGGAGLVSTLQARAAQAGANLRTGAKVTAIRRPGRFELDVAGLTVEADAVLLATGGFMGDLERVRAALGIAPEVGLLRGAPKTADGAGIELGVALGGVSVKPAQAILYAHATPDAEGRALMVVDGREAWTVSTEGAPLPGLLSPRGDSGQALISAPGGRAWMVVDGPALGRLSLFDWEALRMLPARPLLDPARQASSLTELAGRLGLPEAGLLAGRCAEGGRASAERPLCEPPFAAFPLLPSTAKSLTGLAADLDGHVLDAGGQPVAGLYAAGELVGFGEPYGGVPVDSTMVAGAILSGRRAAATLRAELSP